MGKPTSLGPDEIPKHLRLRDEPVTNENRMRQLLPTHEPLPDKSKRTKVMPSGAKLCEPSVTYTDEVPPYLRMGA
jgi:hypothetical protein